MVVEIVDIFLSKINDIDVNLCKVEIDGLLVLCKLVCVLEGWIE